MKLVGIADFLGSEMITSKAGKTFKLLRFVDESGKVSTAFSDDLNTGDLQRYQTYQVTFDYTENGSYKSLSYINAEVYSELDI